MGRRKLRVTQHRNSHKVTFLTPDKGKPGRTPMEERWYKSHVETGWKKDLPEDTRRALMLKAQSGDYLASARALIALHNVTTDRETAVAARKDSNYFFKMHKRNRRPDYRRISKNIKRISPRQRRLD